MIDVWSVGDTKVLMDMFSSCVEVDGITVTETFSD